MKEKIKDGITSPKYSVIKQTLYDEDLKKEENGLDKKDEEKKEEKKPEDPPPLSIPQLFRYSNTCEKFLILIGCLSGAASGLAMPIVIILFGQVTNTFVYEKIKNETFGQPTYHLELTDIQADINASDSFNASDSNFTQSNKIGTMPTKNHTMPQLPDNLINFDFNEEVNSFGIGMVGTGCVQFVFCYLMVVCLNTAAERQVLRVRKLFLRSVLRQDISWFDSHSTGEFASRSAEDLNKLQDGIGEKIGMCALFTSTFISSMIVAFVYGWKLTLVILSVMPVLMVAMAFFAKIQTSLTNEELKAYAKAGAIAEEVFNSIRTVAAFGGEAKEIKRYKENLIDANASGRKRGLISGVGQAISWFIIYGSYSLAFWYGVSLIIESYTNATFEYDPSTLVIVFFSALMGSMNIGQASPYVEALSVARAAAASIYSIIERKPEIDSMSIRGRRPNFLVGNIDFENLHFNYPTRSEVKVLNGFTLKIRSGETVALVGSSGCGKSTIIQLIQRFYDPQEGQIKVDGIDIRQLNVQWLRERIGIVGQEPALFAFTIRENIKMGKEGATEEEILAAAKAANAHDFIMKLPNKYDTVLGENGTQISGGQKQRIAIARAIVKNPRILLLDEATSALDYQSEAKVQEALDKARKGRTTLVIAHRLDTVKSVDRVVVIDKGQICEIGTHAELMEAKGIFYQMVTAQSENKEENEEEVIEDATHALLARALSNDSETANLFDTQVVTKPDEEKEDLSTIALWPILKLNKKEWPYILFGSLGAFGLGFNTPCYAFLFGEIMGVLSITDPDKANEETVFYSCIFLLVGVWAGVCTFLQMYMFAVAGEYLTMRLREYTFSAIVHQEVGWFDQPQNAVGSLCSKLSTDASNVQGATGSRIGILLQTIGSLTTAFIVSVIIAWKLALVSSIFVPLVFIATYLQGKIMMGQATYMLKAQEEAARNACEAISNIRTVASLCREETFYGLYTENLHRSFKNINRQRQFRGLLFAFSQATPMVSWGISLWYGGYLVKADNIEYKEVFKVTELLIFGAMMVGQSIAFAPNYNKGLLSASRILKMLSRRPTIDSESTAGITLTPDDTKATIEFQQVQFSYPTRQTKVLQNLSLQLDEGLTVALVGSSGCGKSTCIQLLERFYDPVEGSVHYSGYDLLKLNVQWLRSQLGLVSQEPVLFDYSIQENIAYGDNQRKVDMSEIIQAAKDANIHNFITSLPQGYDTRVGMKGTQLSGGQKQRIAIARALVRNPTILLLDEATSALDTESEKLVQEALNKAMQGRTCIVIAHRLSTIQKADLIVVLHHGRIAEMGNHQQLLAKRGHYFRLHSTSFQK